MNRWRGQSEIRNPRAATARNAFTLAEMLIAIMILGMGLSMAAAIFPAAMTYNQQSADDILGNIICQNGLSLVKATLSLGALTTTLSENTSLGDDRRYPIDADDDKTGFLVFGRRMASTRNDHQIIIVAYSKADAANMLSTVAKPPPTTSPLADGRYKLVFSAPDTDLQAGSVIIAKVDGAYARILGVDGATVIVDRKLEPGGQNVLVVAETGTGVKKSPVLAVLATRTALKQ